jgi:hypothetical protein
VEEEAPGQAVHREACQGLKPRIRRQEACQGQFTQQDPRPRHTLSCPHVLPMLKERGGSERRDLRLGKDNLGF